MVPYITEAYNFTKSSVDLDIKMVSFHTSFGANRSFDRDCCIVGILTIITWKFILCIVGFDIGCE